MGPSLDRICEMARYVKQYIFNEENRQFYLMHSNKLIDSTARYRIAGNIGGYSIWRIARKTSKVESGGY